MNISIISNYHNHNDDRLYHHFTKTLVLNNHSIQITTCEKELIKKTDPNITFSSINGLKYNVKSKRNIIIEKLNEFKPKLIICSDPISVITAKKYVKKNKGKIIYDITEWYPSKKNIKKHYKIFQPFYFCVYLGLSLNAYYQSDGFIFGEHYKSLIPKLLFSKKKKIFISYYPNEKYIKKVQPNINTETLKLSYSGYLNIEKGFLNFLNVIKTLCLANVNLIINVKLIGEFSPLDKEKCLNQMSKISKNVKFHLIPFQELTTYVKLISDSDIFLDLRKKDFENSHCLPIKLFYYMALERPVIFSNLKAIRKEVETGNHVHLVDPKDNISIATIIQNYQSNKIKYGNHCLQARKKYETKYNWNKVSNSFVKFIESFD